MTAKELAQKMLDVAKNYKTLYVMGCFGSPMNAERKQTYINHHSYNAQPDRKAMIMAASSDTFGFDCVCLIKGLLWGWNGNKNHYYGGATYNSNGVPDINADMMINECTEVSSDFSDIEIGEAVWMPGHIGIYVGDGLAVECTPKWQNKVQITACNCSKSGYNRRDWSKHGKLPYVTYTKENTTKPTDTTTKNSYDYAESFNKAYAKTYTVNTGALNMRRGAGMDKQIIKALKKGQKVICYGYYTQKGSTTWLCVVDLSSGTVGYCSKKYLI